MPNSATAIIIGHLGKDPEVRLLQHGKKVCNATVAVKTGYGEREVTTWWNVTGFEKTADAMERFLKKGTPAQFMGEPYLRQYETSNGAKGSSLELLVSKLVLLGSKDDAKPAPSAGQPVDDDTIPF
jgi:single-strand DNA-binding protein